MRGAKRSPLHLGGRVRERDRRPEAVQGVRFGSTNAKRDIPMYADLCFPQLDDQRPSSHITSMALARKKATTIALDPEDDRLLSRAARERGVSRSEFIRQQLALVLEQYRRHPKPRSAGVLRALTERGDERELFSARR